MKHTIKPGVATGNQVQDIYNYAKQKGFALPAVNAAGSNTINGILETVASLNALVIIQFSKWRCTAHRWQRLIQPKSKCSHIWGSCRRRKCTSNGRNLRRYVILHTNYCAKKLLPWIDGLLDISEEDFNATGKSLFSSHRIFFSEESRVKNIELCKEYLNRMLKMNMTSEIELGITGSEEDSVDISDVDDSKLYTQPEEVAYAYEELSKISLKLNIAAAFGNVHAVYKPRNVKLTP